MTCAMQLYESLVRDVDRMAANLLAYYGAHIVCRLGCSACCECNLSVFEVEAAAVRAALAGLAKGMQRRLLRQACEASIREEAAKPVSCPLLLDESCTVYDARPIICRTQGLPLLIETGDAKQGVDFCPLNFAGCSATDDLDKDHLIPLEEINSRLVMANVGYCHAMGLDPAHSGRRTNMSAIVLGSVGF
jgi:uncharacterized protein